MPRSLHPASLPSTLRIRPYDAAIAALAPFAAFWIRGGSSPEDGWDNILIYAAVALLCTLLALVYFRVSSILVRFFAAHDAVRIGKACAAAIALTIAICFAFNRLDSVPRSVPFIHATVLFIGLAGIPFLIAYNLREDKPSAAPHENTKETILVIGANRIAWFYIRMVEMFSEGRQRVVGILDASPGLLNQTLAGHAVVGKPEDLGRVIDEYGVHGVKVNRVMVAFAHDHYDRQTWQTFEETCSARQIRLGSIADLLSISLSPSSPVEDAATPDISLAVDQRGIWRVKRAIDVIVALLAILILLPVILLIGLAIRLTMGAPVVFWQQRQGLGGAPILVYKFRTLLAPFDENGRLRSDAERLPPLGALLRMTRFDELPQLFNLLSGDMSLIGPRPLLPIDQPEDYAKRLSVRPGITGWAQVNGGKLVQAEDKRLLDEWYIENASLKLDLIIALRTLKIIFSGDGAA